MDEASEPEACFGCGARLPAMDGPTHAYMSSTPACWHAFNMVLAREYSRPDLMPVHRLSVDAWAVQHPGDGSRRAIQSVGLHLARLMVQIEEGLTGERANEAMLGFAARKGELPELPPRRSYRMTIADVVEVIDPEQHRQVVAQWARAVWDDWADQHAFIRSWANRNAP